MGLRTVPDLASRPMELLPPVMEYLAIREHDAETRLRQSEQTVAELWKEIARLKGELANA